MVTQGRIEPDLRGILTREPDSASPELPVLGRLGKPPFRQPPKQVEIEASHHCAAPLLHRIQKQSRDRGESIISEYRRVEPYIDPRQKQPRHAIRRNRGTETPHQRTRRSPGPKGLRLPLFLNNRVMTETARLTKHEDDFESGTQYSRSRPQAERRRDCQI